MQLLRSMRPKVGLQYLSNRFTKIYLTLYGAGRYRAACAFLWRTQYRVDYTYSTKYYKNGSRSFHQLFFVSFMLHNREQGHDKQGAPIITTQGQLHCQTNGNREPVSYGRLAEKVLSRWEKDDLPNVIISWEKVSFPTVWFRESAGPSNGSLNVVSSQVEIVLGLDSNRITFKALQKQVNGFSRSLRGFGSKFWIALEFGDRQMKASKKDL